MLLPKMERPSSSKARLDGSQTIVDRVSRRKARVERRQQRQRTARWQQRWQRQQQQQQKQVGYQSKCAKSHSEEQNEPAKSERCVG